MILGCILQGAGCILQALIYFLPDGYYNFLFIAYLARILQGIGAGFYETPCFSILSIVYKDSYLEKVGIIETFLELGIVYNYFFIIFLDIGNVYRINTIWNRWIFHAILLQYYINISKCMFDQ